MGYMEEQAPPPEPKEKREIKTNRSHGKWRFILRIFRLALFGSVIIYTATMILPEGVLPALTGFQIMAIALGGTLFIGFFIFLLAAPKRGTAVSGSFDLEAMTAVVIGMLVILALSVVSVFASQQDSSIIFWLLLVGIYTFYVFMIIRRGLMLQNENEELKQKYGELLELDEEKTDFVTVTSHQLRTPLNEIKWIFGYAIGQDMAPEARAALQKGLTATNRIVDIVNSILRARTLDLHDGLLKRKDIDMSATISHIIESEQEFTLTFYPPDTKLVISGVEEELAMAIENVIDNAIRYSPNASVTVSLQATRTAAQIRIEDTGIGIAPEDRERVFRKFYRAKNALLIQPDGTGIGLYTAKKIIEKHEGTISFVSEVGKGTTFLILLPTKNP